MPAALEGRNPHRPLTARQRLRHLGGVGGEIVGSLSLRSLAEGGQRGAGLFMYSLKPVPEIVGEVLTEWKSTAASASLHLCKCFTEGLRARSILCARCEPALTGSSLS